VYNNWKGFKYPYTQISTLTLNTDILQRYVYFLANKKEVSMVYIIDWISQMIQIPFEKPGVALCFKSEQGTGKSLFWSSIGRMMGERLSTITGNINNITGNFNGMIENKLLIVGEEISDYVKKSGSQILKDLITGTRQVINKKNFNQYEVKDY